MALEGVVSLGENLIYVYKGTKTAEQAVKDLGRDVLSKGLAAGIGGFGISIAVALGAGPALSAAAPVLVSIGGILYAVSAYSRVGTALNSPEWRPAPAFHTNVPGAPLTIVAARE